MIMTHGNISIKETLTTVPRVQLPVQFQQLEGGCTDEIIRKKNKNNSACFMILGLHFVYSNKHNIYK